MQRLLLAGIISLLSLPAHAANCQDGRELLFMRDQTIMTRHGLDSYTDIYAIKSDGTGLRRITQGAMSKPQYDNNDAAWSPDGNSITFVSNRDGDENPEIYRVDADGNNTQRLTKHKRYDEYPDWSPRGEIIFSSNRDGKDFQLYGMDTKGKLRGRLTQYDSKYFDARWSPDGLQYVFTRERSQGYRLMLGSKGKRPPVPLTPHWMNGSEASWEPDGKALWFVSDGHAPGSGHLELYRMLAKDEDRDGIGDQLERMTHTPKGTKTMEPDISRDGKCVLFVRDHPKLEGPSEIYVMSRDGGRPLRIGKGFGARWR